MDNDNQTHTLIDYITREVIRRPGLQVTADTPLVSSGLIDSFALVNILMKLEDVTNMRISAGKVLPRDLETVKVMLATAKRVGKAKSST